MGYKYCRNCGTANKSENRFCEECGSVLAISSQPAPRGAAPAGVATVTKKSSRKVIIIPVIIAALLLIAGGVFAYFNYFKYNTIDVVKDFDIRVLDLSGADGETMINDVDEDRIKELLDYNDATEEEKNFIDSFRYKWDREDDMHLSNGDKVVVTVMFDEDMAEKYNIKVKNSKHGKVTETITISDRADKKEEATANNSYQTPTQTPYDDHDVVDTNSAEKTTKSDPYEDEKLNNDDGAYYKVSDRKLTSNEIKNWNRDKVQTWINYIYTKHGYKISTLPQSEAQREHFEQFEWYENEPSKGSGEKAQNKIKKKYFTDIEKANEELLVKRRDELK